MAKGQIINFRFSFLTSIRTYLGLTFCPNIDFDTLPFLKNIQIILQKMKSRKFGNGI